MRLCTENTALSFTITQLFALFSFIRKPLKLNKMLHYRLYAISQICQCICPTARIADASASLI